MSVRSSDGNRSPRAASLSYDTTLRIASPLLIAVALAAILFGKAAATMRASSSVSRRSGRGCGAGANGHGHLPRAHDRMATFPGQSVELWAGTASADGGGSVVLYWHGLGQASNEATYLFGNDQIADVVAKGGVVASFTTTNGQGTTTSGNGVWYTGDFDVADQVVACATLQKRAGCRSTAIQEEDM